MKFGKRIKKKKGFTLVELLVVLVILAILAALLIPSLIRYIDKARQTRILGEARSVLTATATKAEEWYGKGELTLGTGGTISSSSISGSAFIEEIHDEANVPDDGVISNVSYYSTTLNVKSVTYARDGITATYYTDVDGGSGEWTLETTS